MNNKKKLYYQKVLDKLNKLSDKQLKILKLDKNYINDLKKTINEVKTEGLYFKNVVEDDVKEIKDEDVEFKLKFKENVNKRINIDKNKKPINSFKDFKEYIQKEFKK